MKTSIFVLSAPRNTDSPWEYLQQTIAEIEKQGPNCYCAIVHDGPYAGPHFPGWDMLAHQHRTGAKGNRDPWWTLFSAALGTPGDALCFEDDIKICPGGLRRMLEFKVPGDLVGVKFFTPKPMRISAAPGLHRLPHVAKRSSGALFLQATKFSHSGIAQIEPFRNHPAYQQCEAADKVLGHACDALGMSIGQHVPDLVQHVGTVSKANSRTGLPWWHLSPDWQADLDVRSLDASLYG